MMWSLYIIQQPTEPFCTDYDKVRDAMAAPATVMLEKGSRNTIRCSEIV